MVQILHCFSALSNDQEATKDISSKVGYRLPCCRERNLLSCCYLLRHTMVKTSGNGNSRVVASLATSNKIFLKWSRFAEISQRLTTNTIDVPLTMPRVISRSECCCMHHFSQAGVPCSHGKNGIIWTRFPVRTSPVFFSIGEPSFLSRSSRSSHSSHQSNTVLDDTVVSVFCQVPAWR